MTRPTAPKKLPILDRISALKTQLAQNNRAILIAPPGAGKTTHVPLALLQEKWLDGRKIIVLEPRRLAARSAAAYMARQLNESVGETVGYRVRSDTRVSKHTRIELVTEGVFVRMALADPGLTEIGAVLFDEFHERNLEGDLGLALAIDIQEGLRDDLRILPMSATLDGAQVKQVLDGAPTLESLGRSHPVAVQYEPRPPDMPLEQAVAQAVKRALGRHEGDVLVFVPGARDIRRTVDLLAADFGERIALCPLYGGLDPHQQDAAIKPAPDGRRKVVVATAIAETSITIEGIRIVVDSGLARVPRFDPSSGLTRLKTERASLSSVEQRKGRAGRTQPGVAVRMWHEGQNGSLPPFPRPEILEADLSSLVLSLAAWGVREPSQLKWLDLPPKHAWKSAQENLIGLGALNADGTITPKGKALQATGNPPGLANMTHEAAHFGLERRAMLLATILSERGLGGNSVDLSTRLTRFLRDDSRYARNLRAIADKKTGGLRPEKNSDRANLSDGAILSLAFPERIAKARNRKETYHLANGRGASLDETSELFGSPYLVVADLQGGSGNSRILAAAALSFDEIETLHGHRLETRRRVFFHRESGQVKASRTTRLGQIQLQQVPVALNAEDDRAQILCDAILQYGLGLLDWNKACQQLLARCRFVHQQAPEQWPDLSEPWLRDHPHQWLMPFIGSAATMAEITPALLKAAITARLGHANLHRLDQEAPTHFEAPTGSRVAIDYSDGEAGVAIRVQELFGLTQHPMAGGRPLVLELLSPAQRLIQKTADLPAFWTGSWLAVRADMRGRYPKHYWPEDPASALPTSRAKPRNPSN